MTPRPLPRRRTTADPPPAVGVDVVVARYREPVNWVRHLPPSTRVTIYDKGGDLDPEQFPWATVTRLENVGVEAQTYLHHILTHREALSDLTLFCQGHPFDHAWDFHATTRAIVAGRERVEAFRWLGHILDTDDSRGRRLFQKWSKNKDGRELAVDEFHEQLFAAPPPDLVRFRIGAQFFATREAILARPLDFWRRAHALALTFPDAGHCFERLWDRVFGVVAIDAAQLGETGTRYLKPIKRLL